MNLDRCTDAQRACVTCLDSPLQVSAGAGSGKTHTLTQRIVYALTPESGPDGATPFLDSIDEALIITFTNKAADEIKARVRTALRSEGLMDEALKVDDAWISTIHGMCTRILRRHALELGIDPEFRMMESVEDSVYVNDAVAQAIRQAQIDPVRKQNIDALFSRYKADTFHPGVKGLAAKLLDQAHLQVDGIHSLKSPPRVPLPCVAALELSDVASAAAAVITGAGKAKVDSILEVTDAWREKGDDLSWDDIAASFETLKECRPTVSKKDEGGVASGVQAALDRCARLCDAARTQPLFDELLALVRDADVLYEQAKRAAGVLSISDLIRTTLTAFTDHPAIAQEYTDRFKLVMVDEFQDTSQLQTQMILRIAGENACHLCTVGDAQQSIYSFQGANVQVYLDHKQAMVDQGVTQATMGDNFRSHSDILSYVRAVCGQPDYFLEPFLDLQPKRDEKRVAEEGDAFLGNGPRLETILCTAQGSAQSACVPRAAEELAARFAALRDKGHSGSQMAVLFGRMSSAPVYAQALRAQGFDCITIGGSGFYDTDEVKLCLLAMRMLANPGNTEALFGLFSSDVLPVSGEDLLTLTTAQTMEGTGFATFRDIKKNIMADEQDRPDVDVFTTRALDAVAQAWRSTGTRRPADVLKTFLLSAGWIARLENGGIEEQAQLGNVLKFIRIVRDTQENAGFDMVSTAAAIEAATAGNEHAGGLDTGSSDAVRLMTVHSSKGLEFPIVAVVDCYETSARNGQLTILIENGSVLMNLNTDSKSRVVSKVAKKYAYSPGDVNPAATTDPVDYACALAARAEERAQAEKRRLFYVAATRAKEALFVVITGTHYTKESSVASWITEAFDIAPDDSQVVQTATLTCPDGAAMTYTYLAVSSPEQTDGDCAEDAPACADVTPAPVVTLYTLPSAAPKPQPFRAADSGFFSYSSIAPHSAFGAPATEVDDDSPVMRASDADKATDFGLALHRACQWYALRPQPVDEALCARQLHLISDSFGLHDFDRLNAAFERWRKSNVCARAFSCAQHQPEVPFAICLDGGILEGEIDLLCHDDNENAFIVDYKTGGLPDETEEALHDKHLLQAQCYAVAAFDAGFNTAEFAFVRVEQRDPTDSTQPQVVPYRFEASEAETLRAAISAIRKQSL